jgi:hypothetical protein
VTLAVLFGVLDAALTDGTTADVKMKMPASAMALSITGLLCSFFFAPYDA